MAIFASFDPEKANLATLIPAPPPIPVLNRYSLLNWINPHQLHAAAGRSCVQNFQNAPGKGRRHLLWNAVVKIYIRLPFAISD